MQKKKSVPSISGALMFSHTTFLMISGGISYRFYGKAPEHLNYTTSEIQTDAVLEQPQEKG